MLSLTQWTHQTSNIPRKMKMLKKEEDWIVYSQPFFKREAVIQVCPQHVL